ncbi:MAG: site-specific DNA-methyltransferase [Sphingomonadaceae bacterium]
MPDMNPNDRRSEHVIEQLDIDAIIANPRNPRTHSPKQIAQIAASIAEFGFTSPILVDHNNMVIAGSARFAAAKDLGFQKLPVIRLEHLTPEQVKAYVITDNKLAANAGWDDDLLRAELEQLLVLDLDFDVTITGFDIPEMDALLSSGNARPSGDDPLDAIPDVGIQAITQHGDCWVIGGHRVMCGDATCSDTYAALFGEERAQMVFCDPPFNVPINGHVSGLGKVKHREFVMASAEMSSEQFTSLLRTAFRHCADWSTDGSLQYHFMDWRHVQEITTAGSQAGLKQINLCVWAKTNAGMGSHYRSQHELVFVFKAGRAPHINNVELGKHKRYRTNVWTYAGANSFGRTRNEDLAMHPTVKPVALVADAILDSSRPKEIILDAFAGSGTTLIAAHKTRRRGFGIELDPLYCDVILRRLQSVTGLDPVHAGTGKTFEEVAAARSVDATGGAA